MLKLFLVIAAFLATVLSGCAELQTVKNQGQQISNTMLETGEYGVCYAATIGSLKRRYGNDADLAAAWERFCTEVWGKESGAELKPITE